MIFSEWLRVNRIRLKIGEKMSQKREVLKKNLTKVLKTKDDSISPSMIKELKKRTGAKLSECRKALEETVSLAPLSWLRDAETRIKKNSVKEAKGSKGIFGVAFSPDVPSLTVLEIACKTDSIAKDEELGSFATGITTLAENNKIESIESLCASKIKNIPIMEVIRKFSLKIGEDIEVKNMIKADGSFGYFVDNIKNEGAIVDLSGVSSEEAQRIGREVATHIVLNSPVHLSKNDSDLDGLVKKESYLKSHVLLEQSFYSNPKQTVLEYIESVSPVLKIDGFCRFKVGTTPVWIKN
jgi:elongation factor Ts